MEWPSRGPDPDPARRADSELKGLLPGHGGRPWPDLLRFLREERRMTLLTTREHSALRPAQCKCGAACTPTVRDSGPIRSPTGLLFRCCCLRCL